MTELDAEAQGRANEAVILKDALAEEAIEFVRNTHEWALDKQEIADLTRNSWDDAIRHWGGEQQSHVAMHVLWRDMHGRIKTLILPAVGMTCLSIEGALIASSKKKSRSTQ